MSRSNEDFKSLYNCLLESEDLYLMFKGMKGDWDKDKIKFIEAQLKMEQMANVINIEDFEQE